MEQAPLAQGQHCAGSKETGILPQLGQAQRGFSEVHFPVEGGFLCLLSFGPLGMCSTSLPRHNTFICLQKVGLMLVVRRRI